MMGDIIQLPSTLVKTNEENGSDEQLGQLLPIMIN